ncbi:MAG TPA: histone deacetylase [Acidimicrobiales bacterium]|nr:histone deacetylase [Acidimicrobiales bacterium]
MSVLFLTHARYLDHVAGARHPERPARLEAVFEGVRRAGVGDALVAIDPRPATRDELELIHPAAYLDAVQRFCSAGGGRIDPDTGASPDSYDVAVLAAGAGLTAVEQLDAGMGTSAFCAVRPPGHHALANRSMGFCLLNNVAVTAAALAQRGERVLIVDFDAHHGNGTQDVFYADARVLYVSMHEWPLYPGTGDLDEIGSGEGRGSTVNFPLPAGATGDVYLSAIDEVVGPLAETWQPNWLLLSAGFDAHRCDPLTGLGLSSGDFGDITARLSRLVDPGRVVAFLEGGYDLDALADSTAACLGALAGAAYRAEASTSGGPGHEIPAAARKVRDRALDA